MNRKIVLFDLGGVLVDLGDPVAAIGLDMSNDDFWQCWLSSPAVRGYETGRISQRDFLRECGAGFGIPDARQFAARIRRWQLPLFAGAEEFLASVMKHVEVALLSNTNEIHWQQVLSQTSVFGRFAKLFLSFETGNAKPDEQSFLDVVEYFDRAPDDIVFLDDNPQNIATASAIGFRAYQTRGIEEARQHLIREGIDA